MHNTFGNILNYQQITPQLATSGQPNDEQLEDIAAAGYQTVINLALSNSDHALYKEDCLVLNLGMRYIHIPIVFSSPHIASARQLFQILATSDQPIWLHCALNYRVSALIYVYRVLSLDTPAIEAQQLLQQIWTLDHIWQRYMQELLADPITISFLT